MAPSSTSTSALEATLEAAMHKQQPVPLASRRAFLDEPVMEAKMAMGGASAAEPRVMVLRQRSAYDKKTKPSQNNSKTHSSSVNEAKAFCDHIKRAKKHRIMTEAELDALPTIAMLPPMNRARFTTPQMAKKSARRLRISNFVVHSVLPSAAPVKHTEYEIVVENVQTGRVWQVARRFSAFFQLRREFVLALAGNHCPACAAFLSRVIALDAKFPSKRIFDSKRDKVVRARANAFHEYLRGLVLLARRAHLSPCRAVSGRYSALLFAFLTVERENFLAIPGGANAAGQQVPSLLRELASVTQTLRLSTIREDIAVDAQDEIDPEPCIEPRERARSAAKA